VSVEEQIPDALLDDEPIQISIPTTNETFIENFEIEDIK